MVCWRAWYDLSQDYEFQKLVLGRKTLPVPWFNLAESEVLSSRMRHAVNQWRLRGAASAEDAQRFLSANYSDWECRCITERLVCPARKRSITICAECEQHVQEDFTMVGPGSALRLCDHVVDLM